MTDELDDVVASEAARLDESTRRINGLAKLIDKNAVAIAHEFIRVRDGGFFFARHDTFIEWANEEVELSRSQIRILDRISLAFSPEFIATHGVTRLDEALAYRNAKRKLGLEVDFEREQITFTDRKGKTITKRLLDASSREIARATDQLTETTLAPRHVRFRPEDEAARRRFAAMLKKIADADYDGVELLLTRKKKKHLLTITGVDIMKAWNILHGLANAAGEE